MLFIAPRARDVPRAALSGNIFSNASKTWVLHHQMGITSQKHDLYMAHRVRLFVALLSWYQTLQHAPSFSNLARNTSNWENEWSETGLANISNKHVHSQINRVHISGLFISTAAMASTQVTSAAVDTFYNIHGCYSVICKTLHTYASRCVWR